jgi:hypothetical protein
MPPDPAPAGPFLTSPDCWVRAREQTWSNHGDKTDTKNDLAAPGALALLGRIACLWGSWTTGPCTAGECAETGTQGTARGAPPGPALAAARVVVFQRRTAVRGGGEMARASYQMSALLATVEFGSRFDNARNEELYVYSDWI